MKYGLAHGNLIRNRGGGYLAWWVELTGNALDGPEKFRPLPKADPAATNAAIVAAARRDHSDPFVARRARLYISRGLLAPSVVQKGCSI